MHTTPWQHGRFDAGSGPSKILFGRMYEDPAIELGVFPRGGRIFSIASAGCTAMELAAAGHEVVAVDINPDQLAYAARRLAGAPAERGTAERVMAFGRAFAPVVGWSQRRVRIFLALDDPDEQMLFWQRELNTVRFRVACDTLFSAAALRAVYASPFLAFLPRRLGAVMRARMERGFARHPNRGNPYARALFLGESPPPVAVDARAITLAQGDAAEWLQAQPAGSFHGFTLSNVLDGAGEGYRERLLAAVRHAARPGAPVVLRSFAEPETASPLAAADRSLLWGIVDVFAT
jgi:S-adenosylmethionine:diacylglycerol 3-amino-3-carboxypropyl transferase